MSEQITTKDILSIGTVSKKELIDKNPINTIDNILSQINSITGNIVKMIESGIKLKENPIIRENFLNQNPAIANQVTKVQKKLESKAIKSADKLEKKK